MAKFDFFKKIDTEKVANMTITNPREIYANILKQASGTGQVRATNFDIFYQIVAFKGVKEGVGCSTLVANTALAVANLGLTVCVVDTSVLAPVQDILLKTKYKEVDKAKRLDWFDMPFTKLSVLHESKLHKNISVLSFYGKERTVIDCLSTNDNANLVDLAYTTLHNKFDLILVDCCHELTSLNIAALQQSQHVIQVWNDDPQVLHCIDSFINSCAILSCPLDKMRSVVYSKVIDDVVGNIDNVLEQYRCKKIGENVFSKDIQRLFALGKFPYQHPTDNEDIIGYTNCIIDVACHVCNIKREDEPKGTITSNDIMDGKVEGTLHKELKDYNDKFAEEHPDLVIATSLESADAQVSGKMNISKEIERQKEEAEKEIPVEEITGVSELSAGEVDNSNETPDEVVEETNTENGVVQEVAGDSDNSNKRPELTDIGSEEAPKEGNKSKKTKGGLFKKKKRG